MARMVGTASCFQVRTISFTYIWRGSPQKLGGLCIEIVGPTLVPYTNASILHETCRSGETNLEGVD
jgi:hypothetical protein